MDFQVVFGNNGHVFLTVPSLLVWCVFCWSSCAKYTILSGSVPCYHLGTVPWICCAVVCLTSLRFVIVESELFESCNSRL